MRFVFFAFLSILIVTSCKQEEKAPTTNSYNKKKDTTVLKIKTLLPVKLNTQANKTVSEWDEYQNIREYIPNFYQTDTKQSLFDSQRILELSQQLKDSIRIERFDIPSFRARLHVLYNESLRLADMDSIKSITKPEIALQTKNIVNAFDAINSKINMLVSQDLLEENLKEFDSILNKNDSTKKEFKPFILPSKSKTKKRSIKRISPLIRKQKLQLKKRREYLRELKKIKKSE